MTMLASPIEAAGNPGWRFPALIGAMLVAIGLMLTLHIAVGTLDFSPLDVLLALIGQPVEPLHHQVVNNLRLPRGLVAIASGAMLGVAGAILQTVSRNPLAEPGLMGVSGGAVLAIVLALVFFGGALGDSSLALPLIGVVGGLATGTLTYLLSLNRGSDPIRLVLMGVLVAGLVSALTTVVLLGARENDIMRIVRWTVGSTSGRVWVHWSMLWPFACAGVALALLSAGAANALQLGDSVARGLGQRVEWTRLWLLFVAALLTAGAVSVVGAIALIGLIGPHIARRLVGNDARKLYPVAGLVTAILLLASDIVARTIEIGWITLLISDTGAQGTGLPVGAVTALIGVPFFLHLLLTHQGDRA